MRKQTRVPLLPRLAAPLLLALGAAATAQASPPPAPTPTPTPPLNEVTNEKCPTREQIGKWIAEEERQGLVMDARPFAINQSTGRLNFSGSTGRVTVAHMNPFAYDYQITVAQQELLTTALSEFVKLLLPPNLGTFAELQSGDLRFLSLLSPPQGELGQIASRIQGMKPAECKSPDDDDPKNPKSAACIATGEMYKTFELLQRSSLLGATGGAATNAEAAATLTSTEVETEYKSYIQKVAKLRDRDADAYQTCTGAKDLKDTLSGYKLPTHLENLEEAQKAINDVRVLVNDLKKLVADFKADQELKESKPVIRCKGYNCTDQFDAYATAATAVLDKQQARLTTLKDSAVKMQKMYLLVEQLKDKQGLFARTFTVIKKFELSQATVSVKRTEIPEQGQQGQTQSGRPGTEGGASSPQPVLTGGESSDGTAPVSSGGGHGTADSGGGSNNQQGGGNSRQDGGGNNAGAGNNLAPTGQLNEVIQIGRPRFALSGGMVYSPLHRQTFTSVKGFARDAQGNPTGNGSADVAGFGENSSRRLLPMVILNTRLTDLRPVNLYFSWGISAKRDDNFDMEYLFGPSVGLLNDRAFFTFGAYGGMTQNLGDDINLGDTLPDTIGDAKLFRKKMVWKPGLSFSYNFSRTKKREAAAGATSNQPATPAADLKNEIRIGSIPFNLALGFAYTSLEQRTFDEVVGFARDRQGNLTNGRTLTRIVGPVSGSDYRLTPLVLLHSRLTNFGPHDFYFSTGVTGKKTDNNFDIEYLVGGSMNLYRRKAFITVGLFAGKQQILGGDFFEGAALAKTQNVTTQNRYVWKPAISFSYDVTKIVKRAQ